MLPAGAVVAGDCLRRIDVCGLDEAGLRACIAEAAPAAECRLAPAAGVMVQAVWFDAGAQASGRLLLTIHHLAVDGVSWRILVPELAAAGRRLRAAACRRWRRGNLVSRLGAAAGVACARWRSCRGACVLARDAGCAVAVAGRRRARSSCDINGTAGRLALHVAGQIPKTACGRTRRPR